MPLILYEHQWQDNPHAIVDIKTPNESFLRYCHLLKSMGVSNHLFPLQLHNPDLVGIDPHDKNLELDAQLAIALECKTNFYYFLRSVIRVPGGDDDDPIKFKANRGNMALFWLFFNHITTILIQIRQTGKSFSTDVLMTYLLNLRCTKTEINLLTKDDTLRASNLERLKNIELELPYYLRMRTKADVGNTEELSVKAMGNRYRGHLPNKSPKMALNVGRGLTSPIFQVDEAAFFFNIAISLPAALAAGTAARDRARARGEPYGTILTTTAGKKDDRDGAYMYNMVQYSASWSEGFFDCKNEEDLNITVALNCPQEPGKAEKNIRVNCTFNHRQLGYDDAWLKRAIREAEVQGEDADRDFGNVWTSGSQSSPLTVEQAATVRDSQVLEPYHDFQPPYNYIIRWYVPKDQITQFMASNHVIWSIDSSEAGGQDDITLTGRSILTGEIVAAGNYNETNLIKFCQWLVTVLVTYQNTTLIIERRSTGAMILDYLLLLLPEHGINPFLRIYNKVVQEQDEYPERFREVNSKYGPPSQEVLTKYKKAFGFATSASGATSRSELYGTTLMNAVKLTGTAVRDKQLIDQLLALVFRNGRVDHPPGGKDDLCISWLLGFWLLTHGKNLQTYGINPRGILLRNDTLNESQDGVSVYDRQYQEALKHRIDGLIQQLKNERDDFIAKRLEMRVRQLGEELSTQDRQVLALDELMSNIREFRRINRPSQMSYYDNMY